MAGEVIVDALPYIDQGYDEAGVREAALAMVDEETRRYRPTKNYLEHLPPLNISQFETEMMRSEWERMQQRQPMDVLSMKRYELPPPPAGKMTDIAAWTECVENSLAQLEHQATRICNLELMLDFGCEAWKTYLELLVASVTQAQKSLQTLRKDIQEINWERKNAQMKGGEKLRDLEATWVGLVSKNYDIEQACVMLEEEYVRLVREKEYGARRRKLSDDRADAKRRKLEQEGNRERELELQRQQEEQQRLMQQQMEEQQRQYLEEQQQIAEYQRSVEAEQQQQMESMEVREGEDDAEGGEERQEGEGYGEAEEESQDAPPQSNEDSQSGESSRMQGKDESENGEDNQSESQNEESRDAPSENSCSESNSGAVGSGNNDCNDDNNESTNDSNSG